MSSVDYPAPDPNIGEAAKTNAAIAGRALDLQEQAYNDQMKLVNEFSPLLKEQIQLQADQQRINIGRSDQQWASYQKNFAPLEAEMAKRAREYDTPAKREAAAAAARGEVAGDFALARQQSREGLAAAGLQPGSGASRAAEGQINIAEATAKAGAANSERARIESVGMSYLDNATRFGRNMPSAGLATAGLAQSQGAGVAGGYGALASAYAQPAATSVPLLQAATGANTASGNLSQGLYGSQLQAAGMQAQADASTASSVGALAGTAAMLFMY